MRHVRVGDLWIQERIEDGDLDMTKVSGEDNPADALTKNVNGGKLGRCVWMSSQEFREGRADKGLRLKVREEEGKEPRSP